MPSILMGPITAQTVDRKQNGSSDVLSNCPGKIENDAQHVAALLHHHFTKNLLDFLAVPNALQLGDVSQEISELVLAWNHRGGGQTARALRHGLGYDVVFYLTLLINCQTNTEREGSGEALPIARVAGNVPWVGCLEVSSCMFPCKACP